MTGPESAPENAAVAVKTLAGANRLDEAREKYAEVVERHQRRASRIARSAALGVRALPSTRFELTRAGSGWRATGSGFGHGVGLCQAGALARARRGSSAAEILGFYYPGAIIGRAAAR